MTRDEEIVDPALLTRYRNLLHPSEAERMQRFRLPRHQHQHLVARALVRHVLGLYLDVPAAALRFAANAYGKPYLVQPFASTLCFNLSHSDGCIVFAVAANGDIGVDIETTPGTAVPLDVAQRYFSAVETEQLARTPAHLQTTRFLDFWTLKEAYIKACGEGLSIPLDQFAFTFGADERASIAFAPGRNDQPERWRFWQVLPDGGQRIAIAHRSRLLLRAGPLTVRVVVPLQVHRTIDPRIIASAPEARLLLPA